MESIIKAKPSSVKGTYFQKLSLSSTMSPGIKVNKSEFLNKLVKENGLDLEQDLWALPFKGDGGKSKHIVAKTGIEKIQYNNFGA